MRSATAIALQKRGYSVLSAADGHSAVEMFCSRPDDIAVVVLDMNLPMLSGREVYRQIRAVKPETKIMFTSGHAINIAEAALSAQSARFLQKPYTISGLISALHETLSESGSIATTVETSSRSAKDGRARTTTG